MSRNYSSTAADTALAAPTNDSQTSMTVDATTGFPAAPYVLVVDPGTVSQELVLVTGVAGTTLTITRGYDSTSAVSHLAGAVVQHSHAAIDFREAAVHIDASDGVHGLTGDVVGTTDTQTLTNKTIDLTDNTLTGTKSEFDAACSDGNFVYTSGAQSLSDKTLSLDAGENGANFIEGLQASSFVRTDAQGNIDSQAAAKAVPGGTVVGTTDSQTLTNKTVNLSSNTLTGTTAQFNTALTDGNFATQSDITSLDARVDDLEVRAQAGVASVTLSASAAGFTDVVFDTAFSSTPVVVPGSSNSVLVASYANVTTTGFRLTLRDKGEVARTGSFDASWIAFLP